MDNNKRHTLRTVSRKSVTVKPTVLSEIVCGLLAAVTAILIWLGSAPM